MARGTGFDSVTLKQGLRGSSIDRRHVLETFTQPPIAVQPDGTVAAGDDTQDNLLYTGNALWLMHNIGVQTVVVPVLEEDGLDIGRTKTNDVGTELTHGILARSPLAFVAGTDRCFVKATLKIADVSGVDELAIGFRKAAAFAALLDNYTDMAALNVQLGNVFVETILNDTATTATDTTDNWADAATHELAVFVSRAGVASYQIDGGAPTVVPAAAFTFDAADVLIPFCHLLHAATSPGKVHLQRWECGLQ